MFLYLLISNIYCFNCIIQNVFIVVSYRYIYLSVVDIVRQSERVAVYWYVVCRAKCAVNTAVVFRESVGSLDDVLDYFDVILHKPPRRGLGLSIVGKR